MLAGPDGRSRRDGRACFMKYILGTNANTCTSNMNKTSLSHTHTHAHTHFVAMVLFWMRHHAPGHHHIPPSPSFNGHLPPLRQRHDPILKRSLSRAITVPRTVGELLSECASVSGAIHHCSDVGFLAHVLCKVA